MIQPTGEITFRQVDLQPLWQKHNASLASLIVGNQEFLAVRSRSSFGSTQPLLDLPTLHQLLIDPIASLLPKDPNAHVIFIPQGSLFQIPFPALQDASGNLPNPKTHDSHRPLDSSIGIDLTTTAKVSTEAS